MRKWIAMGAVAALLLSVFLACGKGSPTLPTPVPSAVPSPSGEVFPGPLHIEGERWVSPKGPVFLLGGIVCCGGPGSAEYPRNGWPWASEGKITELASYGGNYVHFRLGPFTPQGESSEFVAYGYAPDGRIDLSVWDDIFWSRLTQRISFARQKGLYVELDLIDGWVLKYPSIHPWAASNNVNGVDEGSCEILKKSITPLQERWITKIIDTTRGFDNVIYQISNESGVCGNKLRDEWELSILDLVHRLHPRALVGTNSGHSTLESAADYVNRHSSDSQMPQGTPMMVNEYTDPVTSGDVCREMEEGRQMGSSYHAWRADLSAEEYARVLECLRSTHAKFNAGN